MHEDKKIETINIQYNSLTQCTVEFLHWVMQVILKLFSLKLGSGDCFCCTYTVRSFCSIYAGESVCSWYVGDNFFWNYASGSLCCRYYFLQSIMQLTISIVVIQVTISVAMYVTVSSSKFIFLSLTNTHFS